MVAYQCQVVTSNYLQFSYLSKSGLCHTLRLSLLHSLHSIEFQVSHCNFDCHRKYCCLVNMGWTLLSYSMNRKKVLNSTRNSFSFEKYVKFANDEWICYVCRCPPPFLIWKICEVCTWWIVLLCLLVFSKQLNAFLSLALPQLPDSGTGIEVTSHSWIEFVSAVTMRHCKPWFKLVSICWKQTWKLVLRLNIKVFQSKCI